MKVRCRFCQTTVDVRTVQSIKLDPFDSKSLFLFCTLSVRCDNRGPVFVPKQLFSRSFFTPQTTSLWTNQSYVQSVLNAQRSRPSTTFLKLPLLHNNITFISPKGLDAGNGTSKTQTIDRRSARLLEFNSRRSNQEQIRLVTRTVFRTE